MADLVKAEQRQMGLQPRKRKEIKVKPTAAPAPELGYSPEAMALVQGIADRASDESDLIVGLEQNYDRILDASIDQKRKELAPKLEARRAEARHGREQQAIAQQAECQKFVADFFAQYGLEAE
jgi:hypothetical protein